MAAPARRILLIDDDRLQFRLTQAHFKNFRGEPYELDWAATYEEGLEKLLRGTHAACLLDYQLGERDGLRLVDADSLSGPIKITPVPNGGWSTLMDLNPPTAGFQAAGWNGLAWAPSGLSLAKRRLWVVEATPHDKYYLYGRIELWVDAETWAGAWNRKFSWNGELINTYQLSVWTNHPIGPSDNPEWMPAGTMAYACAEYVKANRATIGGLRADPQAAYHRRVPLEANLFDSMSLTRFGK